MTKQFKIKVNGNPYLVEVEEVPSAAAPVLNRPASFNPTAPDAFQPRVVQGSVSAPMPGVVTKIFCNPGDKVEVGQAVLALEAMKMENEVTADKAGIVQEIRASVGQSVASGDILAVIA